MHEGLAVKVEDEVVTVGQPGSVKLGVVKPEHAGKQPPYATEQEFTKSMQSVVVHVVDGAVVVHVVVVGFVVDLEASAIETSAMMASMRMLSILSLVAWKSSGRERVREAVESRRCKNLYVDVGGSERDIR